MAQPPSDDEILARLQRPLVAADPPERCFRLGLVLNGTVAAGAWTAGVLDALMQALDAWQAAKQAGEDVPTHTVRLEILGGASGGGVCAALLARAATRRFPHVAEEAGATAANPFWRVWVDTLDIANMLTEEDLRDPGAPAVSLLDGRAIALAAQAILDWGVTTQGVTALAAPRPWLADPLHVLVTLTNLRGVPYGIAFEPSGPGAAPRESWYVDHADHALFAFPQRAGAPLPDWLRGDAAPVPADFVAGAADWQRFAQFVRGTGAFPIGFPPLRLSRPVEDYRWRAMMEEGGKRDGQPMPPQPRLNRPAWSALPPQDRPGEGPYAFDCVDGGALNNQPVELVRTGLAGLGNRLEREATKASAAVVLIDPFAAAPECRAPGKTPDLLGVGLGLTTAWKSQARYATADLLLALDPTVFSRFLLTAGRTDARNNKVWGGAAVAGAGFGAFLGFLDRRYRVHDYLLGRKNCLDWLAKHFALPEENPLFGGFGATAAAEEYRPGPGDRRLPIIPVVAPLRGTIPQPAWPILDPATNRLEGALTDRLHAVADRLGEQSGIPCSGLLSGLLSSWVARYAVAEIGKAAKAQNARA